MDYIRELLGFEKIEFTSAQENSYQQYFADSNNRYLRAVLFLALLLIALVGLFDFYVYDRQSWPQLVLIRYGFGTPIVIALVWFTLSKHFIHYQQQTVTICCIFFVVVLAAMLTVAPDNVVLMYQPGFSIAAVFAGAVGRLRFSRAVLVCVFIAAVMNILVIFIRPQPMVWVLSCNYFYSSIAMISLAVNLYISLHSRRSYLSAQLLSEKCDELAEANCALAEQARTDPLTGLFNRREIERSFDREWRRAIRKQLQLSFLMIDVDHFKKYNDKFGHPRGDECLKALALILQKVFSRGADVVARYGGEEFAVLLPETSNKSAQQLATALAVELAKYDWNKNNTSIAEPITLSIGLASGTPKQGEEYISLIALADKSLYVAKKQGRNRLVNAVESELPILLG